MTESACLNNSEHLSMAPANPLVFGPPSLTDVLHESLPAEPIQNRSNDIQHNFWYRQRAVICAISMLGCWAAGMLSPPLLLEHTAWDWGLDTIGWCCFISAILIRLWASMYIGGRKARRVICEGPYSVCRNPLYWGTLLAVVSQLCFFHSITFALGLVVPLMIYAWGVVPAEERHLTHRLGAEYRAYCAAVPRWIPRFSRYRSPEILEVDVHGMKKEVLRILGWAWLPLFADLVNHLRECSWWPHPFRLW